MSLRRALEEVAKSPSCPRTCLPVSSNREVQTFNRCGIASETCQLSSEMRRKLQNSDRAYVVQKISQRDVLLKVYTDHRNFSYPTGLPHYSTLLDRRVHPSNPYMLPSPLPTHIVKSSTSMISTSNAWNPPIGSSTRSRRRYGTLRITDPQTTVL